MTTNHRKIRKPLVPLLLLVLIAVSYVAYRDYRLAEIIEVQQAVIAEQKKDLDPQTARLETSESSFRLFSETNNTSEKGLGP